MPKRKTTAKRKTPTKKKTRQRKGGFIPIAPLLTGLAGSLLPNLLGVGQGLMLPGTRR